MFYKKERIINRKGIIVKATTVYWMNPKTQRVRPVQEILLNQVTGEKEIRMWVKDGTNIPDPDNIPPLPPSAVKHAIRKMKNMKVSRRRGKK